MIAGSKKPMSEKLRNYTVDADECHIWNGCVDKDGYGRISGTHHGKRYLIRANRASYAYHVGDIPAGKDICHHCDKPRCIKKECLYVGDAATNGADKKRRGRARSLPRFGAANPMYGRTGDKNPFFGKQHTDETKARISATKRGVLFEGLPRQEFLQLAN